MPVQNNCLQINYIKANIEHKDIAIEGDLVREMKVLMKC